MVTNKQTIEKGHGRIDIRTYFVLPACKLDAVKDWKGLQSIGMAITESERANKKTKETRYFIASFLPDVERFSKAVRNHWAIENKLHWTLDVTFREDESRVRKDYAPVNFSLIRKLSLNILRADKNTKKKPTTKNA